MYNVLLFDQFVVILPCDRNVLTWSLSVGHCASCLCRLCIMFYRQSFFGSDVSTSAIPLPPITRSGKVVAEAQMTHIMFYTMTTQTIYLEGISKPVIYNTFPMIF